MTSWRSGSATRSWGTTPLRIYTSLDPELQRAASEAVEAGMKNVDELVRKQHKKSDTNITYPQVALVALNPHTGQILALVGGRNYGISQLNHAMAERPTGSIFKPFVYAAAYNTSLNGTDLDGEWRVHGADEAERRSAELHVRRQGVYAGQLRARRVSGHGDGGAGDCALAEYRDHQPGAAGWV